MTARWRDYKGLLLSARSIVSAQHYTFLANYTDSYCLSDYDFGAALAGSTNSQIFNRHADWGPCISDARIHLQRFFRSHQFLEERQQVYDSAAARLAT